MTIGASIFLIALGAILNFAVTAGRVGPLEIHTIGLILMIVGIVGLILALLYLRMLAPQRDVADREIVRERERL